MITSQIITQILIKVLISFLAGSFSGIVAPLFRGDRGWVMPYKKVKGRKVIVDLGIFGNILTGGLSGTVAGLLASMVNLPAYSQIIGMIVAAVLAGYSGNKYLEAKSAEYVNEKKAENAQKISNLLTSAVISDDKPNNQ